MIAAGRRSKCSCTSAGSLAGSISEVPNVSTITDTGRATPMAYATWTSQRCAMPAATMFFAAWRTA